MSAAGLAKHLAAIVGQEQVLSDPALTAGYALDQTGRFRGRARLVVRPQTVGHVREIIRLCAAAGQPVVPQGGNTGLVGGSVPMDGEVVLSMRGLREMRAADAEAAQLTVEAGVSLAQVHDAAAAIGYAFAIDMASRDSATVGGIIATNAGGIRAVRYGAARAQLLGVEAVLADGSLVQRLGGLPKDNTGYDLAGLFAGSEGTLAVITAARLRLVPRWRHHTTVLLGLDGIAAAAELAVRLRRRLPALEAAEVFDEAALGLVLRRGGGSSPVPASSAYLLVECAADRDPTSDLADALAEAGIDDALVATEPAERRRLWDLREGITDAIAREGIAHKLDVSLPLHALSGFDRRVHELVRGAMTDGQPARTVLFGHIADGNLHVNLLGLPPDDQRPDDAVLRLVLELGGNISAEHGIGRAKRRWLPLDRSFGDLAAMRSIKRALDPEGLLNPGVLIDIGDSATSR